MFDTHKLNEKGFEAVKEFKNTMAEAVKEAAALIPEGRDRSIFITKMEEGMFFGTRGIASLPENHTEIVTYPQ